MNRFQKVRGPNAFCSQDQTLPLPAKGLDGSECWGIIGIFEIDVSRNQILRENDQDAPPPHESSSLFEISANSIVPPRTMLLEPVP